MVRKFLTVIKCNIIVNRFFNNFIVDRVQEAEKEVSQMLLKSIEHHIQDAGKVLLKQDESKSFQVSSYFRFLIALFSSAKKIITELVFDKFDKN